MNERLKKHSLKLSEKIFTPVISIGVTVFLSIIVSSVINNLPRSSQGERILIPWAVCLVGSMLFQILFPIVISLLFIKNKKLIKYICYCLFASVLGWYFFIGPVIYKAWNRGL